MISADMPPIIDDMPIDEHAAAHLFCMCYGGSALPEYRKQVAQLSQRDRSAG